MYLILILADRKSNFHTCQYPNPEVGSGYGYGKGCTRPVSYPLAPLGHQTIMSNLDNHDFSHYLMML